jgi:hypothetical protein
VFDQGYDTDSWLKQRWGASIHIVVHWKKGTKLIDAMGQKRKAWEIARSKRRWREDLLNLCSESCKASF